MLAMGEPSGKAKGGIARAAKLSAETRRNIARRAAMVRWARRAPKKDDDLTRAPTGTPIAHVKNASESSDST